MGWILWVAVGILALAAAVAVVWWLSLRPSNTRAWQPDVAYAPTVDIAGDQVTVHNVRNFRYRSATDFDERWEDRHFDLSRINGLDMFFSHWSSALIAHTIMSWSFSDGQHLAISAETRKRGKQQYSSIAGFFRQYELIYVAADERDVIRLRTDIRRQDVYLYRLKVGPLAARNLLLAYFEAMNVLSRNPRWYNALVMNCTTAIRERVIHAGGEVPFSWRLFANGYLPDWLYRRGSLDTSQPFARLKAMSRVSERAMAVGDVEDFSARIREGLPIPSVS